MKLSDTGRKLIQSFEGCKLTAYQDQGGVWTIGYGATGPEVCKGLQWGQNEANTRFLQDVSKFELGVDLLVTVPLTQGEFDALVSFAYNLGLGALKGSTMLRKLNNSDYDGAALEFLKWDHIGKEKIAGLTRRREAEKKRFEELT